MNQMLIISHNESIHEDLEIVLSFKISSYISWPPLGVLRYNLESVPWPKKLKGQTYWQGRFLLAHG